MNNFVILAFLLFSQTSASTSSSLSDRNPFRPVQPVTGKSAMTPVQEPSAPVAIQEATPTVPLESRFLQTGVPPILDDLRSVALMKGGKKLAMFGRRIVSLDEEIAGYRVDSISIDQVVLKKGEITLVRTLDEFSKRSKSPADESLSPMAMPIGMDQILSSFLSPGSNSGSNILDLMNQTQSINSILKMFLGKNQTTSNLPETGP